ncbi:MAG: hypothetical protein SGJ02_03100 [bacterium]|nr:hypothetical protein [bacterium]
MLKDFKEKIKIATKMWLCHIEKQFLPELCSGLFFISKITVY